MNTIFILVARNSQLGLSSLETKAGVTMNIEGLEKLIFTHIHFTMNIGLDKDTERERKPKKSIRSLKTSVPSVNHGEKTYPSPSNSIMCHTN